VRVYIDTSAAAKFLQEEPESQALAAWADDPGVELVSANLIETELRRVALRNDIDQAAVTQVLNGIGIHDLDATDFHLAGLLPGEALRSLDALHLQAALATKAECVLTYDARMAHAARSGVGLPVISPA